MFIINIRLKSARLKDSVYDYKHGEGAKLED
jgi:hypothetical protein